MPPSLRFTALALLCSSLLIVLTTLRPSLAKGGSTSFSPATSELAKLVETMPARDILNHRPQPSGQGELIYIKKFVDAIHALALKSPLESLYACADHQIARRVGGAIPDSAVMALAARACTKSYLPLLAVYQGAFHLALDELVAHLNATNPDVMVYVNRVLNLDDPNLGRRPIQSYVNAYDMNEEYLMRHMEGRRVTAFLRQDPELMTCLFWGMIHYSDHVMDIEDLEYYVIEQLAVVRGANIRERYIRSVGVPQTMASSPEVIHPTTSETSESRDALPSIRMNFNPTTFEMEARAAWTRLQETRPNVHDERLRIALILWDANRDIITGRNELAPSDPYGIYMT